MATLIYPATSPTADESTQLPRELAEHPLFRSRRIRLEREHACVVLLGQVHSFYEKQWAQETVRRLDGVEQIDNRLEVAYRSA